MADELDEMFNRLTRGRATVEEDDPDAIFRRLTRQDRKLAEATERAKDQDSQDWRLAINATPFGGTILNAKLGKVESDAWKRYQAGEADADDLKVLATAQRQQELSKTRSTGRAVVEGLSHLPALVGEMAVAAPLAAPLRAARLGAIPAAELATGGARLGVVTAATPKMYVEAAHQNANEQGGEWTDPKNLVPAFAHGAIQTAILGRGGKGGAKVGELAGQGAIRAGGGELAKQAAVGAGSLGGRFAAGLAESEVAEAVARNIDLSTRYGTLTELYKSGGENWKEAIAHAVTFGVFAGMHVPGDVKQVRQASIDKAMSDFRDQTLKLSAQGWSKERIGEKLNQDWSKLAESQKPVEPAPTPTEPAPAPEKVPAPEPPRQEIVDPGANTAVESTPPPAPAVEARPEPAKIEVTPQKPASDLKAASEAAPEETPEQYRAKLRGRIQEQRGDPDMIERLARRSKATTKEEWDAYAAEQEFKLTSAERRLAHDIVLENAAAVQKEMAEIAQRKLEVDKERAAKQLLRENMAKPKPVRISAVDEKLADFAARQAERKAKLRSPKVEAAPAEPVALEPAPAPETPPPAPKPSVAFSGAPIQITALDNLLNKGNSITNAARKWLTSAGDLPPEVFAEKVKADGRIAAFAQEVRNAEKDLQRTVLEATGKRWDQLSEDQVKPLTDALKGDSSALERIPPSIRSQVEAMRANIDGLSQALIESGAIAEPLIATVEGNVGVYLNRAYRVFTDPKWSEKVDPAVRNLFKSWLMAEGAAENLAEAEGITKSLLYNGTAEESPIAFLAKSKLGSKDLGILKQRKDLPAELRALWGEFQDPLVNYANTVGRMSNLLVQHQFLKTVRDQNLGTHFFEKPTETHFARIAPAASEVMNPLNGLYTTPEIKKAFENVYAKKETSALMKAYMTIMGMTKYSKTILSPVTHIRNLLGNTGFAVANGHYRVGKALPALKTLATDTPASRATYQRLLELGIVNDSVQAGEFRNIVNDVLGERDITMGESLNRISDKRIVSWVRKGGKLVEKLYHAEDAVWKTYAFENEKARYREAYPSWTEAQIEQRAADIVRNTYPTYSMVPAAVKSIRRFPLVGPFVSFPSEVVRTTYHTAKLALEELRTPETKQIGATRMAGLALSLTIPAALAAGTRAMFGISRDEERAMRRFLPDWSQDNHLLHLGKNEKGEPRYIDLGYSDPHAYLWSPVLAATRGEDYKESLQNATERVSQPFFNEELLSSKLIDLARNRQRNDAPVYNPQAPLLDRAETAARHVGEALEPGAVGTGRRIGMALTQTPDQRTGRRYDPQDEITAAATGQRLQYIKPEESLMFKARAFLRQKQDAAGLLTEVAGRRGVVADADLQSAHAKMEQARKKLYDEMRLDIQAAQTLGLTPTEIIKALKAAGMSDADATLLWKGVYVPYQMDRNALMKRAGGDVPLTPAEAVRRAGVVGKAASGK